VTEDILKDSWLYVVAGYAVGVGSAPILYAEEDRELSSILAGLPRCYTKPSLLSALDERRRLFERFKAISDAREELSSRGYALTEESMAKAVERDQVDVAELYLRAGFEPDAVNELGTPVLVLAVRSGAYKIARLLVQHGADIGKQSSDRGNTALMESAVAGNAELTRLLLERGADVDTQNLGGQTALTLAVADGKLEVAHLLLERGADPFIADKLGMSAYKYAELFGHASILERVEERTS
jgi:hypothetical protein